MRHARPLAGVLATLTLSLVVAGGGVASAGIPAKGGLNPKTREVCSKMVRDGVKAELGSFSAPPAGTTAGDTFTCRYAFANGSLAMSVRDLRTSKAARGYFRQLEAAAGPVNELAGVGQGAFSKADGSAVVVKDSMVLTIDVTRAPPVQLPPATIGSDLASVVMGCWVAS